MVGLVPLENNVIPLVVLMNMYLVKGTLDYFVMWCGWVQGNSDGPLVPMVQLVPLENHVIPMVLLLNMQKKEISFI